MNSFYTASLFHKLLMAPNFNALKIPRMVALPTLIIARKNREP